MTVEDVVGTAVEEVVMVGSTEVLVRLKDVLVAVEEAEEEELVELIGIVALQPAIISSIKVMATPEYKPPSMATALSTVMDTSAKTFPAKILVAPRVTELPTALQCHMVSTTYFGSLMYSRK